VAVVGWGMAPSEFWGLTPAEFWIIHERKRPRDPKKDYAGSLTESDVKRLEGMLKKYG